MKDTSVPCCTCSHPPCLPQSLCSSLPLYTACRSLARSSSSRQLHGNINNLIQGSPTHATTDKRKRPTGRRTTLACVHQCREQHVCAHFITSNELVCSSKLCNHIRVDGYKRVSPAKEEVSTTRLTVSFDLAALSSTVLVPSSAGSTNSFWVSSQEDKNGDAMWNT